MVELDHLCEVKNLNSAQQGEWSYDVGFGCRSLLVVELDHLCEVNNLYFVQVGMLVSRSVYGKALKRQLVA